MSLASKHGTHFDVRVSSEIVQEVLRTGFTVSKGYRVDEGVPKDAKLVDCEFDRERGQLVLKFFSESGHPFGRPEITPIVSAGG